MKISKLDSYAAVLLIVALIAFLAGLCTVLPGNAENLNMLGYRSNCPMVPISTLLCWLAAFYSWNTARKHYRTYLENKDE